MTNLTFRTVLVLLSAIPFFCGLSAQDKSKQITLSLEKSGKGFFTIDSSSSPVKVWIRNGNSNPDSILYEYNLEDKLDLQDRINDREKTSACAGLPKALNILVKNESELRTVSLLKRYNPFLEKEWTASYRIDSLKEYFENKKFCDAIPIVEIDYPVCINNKVENITLELYFSLYEKAVTYYDPMMQKLPLFVSATKKRQANYMGYSIIFKKNEYTKPDDQVVDIHILDVNRELHSDSYENGISYKHAYNIGDTIYLKDSFYRLAGISPDWNCAYIDSIGRSVSNERYISEIILSEIKPYLSDDKKYVILDFWATWCAPCIATFPKLKELYNEIHMKYDFLGVCFDSPDNFEKAKQIYSNNQIPWSQVMDNSDNLKQTISYNLKAYATLPTYVVIDKNGKIIYSKNGTEGFEDLLKLVRKLK